VDLAIGLPNTVPGATGNQWRQGFEAAWSRSGRSEQPRNAALAYFSLGDRAEEDARAYLTDYYAWLGEDTADAAGL
jgi:hypothetical protein